MVCSIGRENTENDEKSVSDCENYIFTRVWDGGGVYVCASVG